MSTLSQRALSTLRLHYGESFGKSLSSTQGGDACHVKETVHHHPAFNACLLIVRVTRRRVAQRRYDTFIPFDGRQRREHWAARTVYEKTGPAMYEVLIINEQLETLEVVGACTTIAAARRLFRDTRRVWG